MQQSLLKVFLTPMVIIGGLGYFVDIFDLVLFSVVRTASLRELGFTGEALFSAGVKLLNVQMAGLLVGGFLWGILGDKKGRKSGLFGSILLYSLANLGNAFVQDLTTYAALRFLAGVGLAGELGAAVTLVAESLPKEQRGYGTAFVAGIGLFGAVAAGLIGDFLSWRIAYGTGGILGLMLLLTRTGLSESKLFASVANRSEVPRGKISLLFTSRERALKFLSCVGIAIPIWFVVGIIVTFSPELCAAMGVKSPVSAGRAILWCYTGLSLGDFLSGFWSQWRRSRKRVVRDMLLALAVLIAAILSFRNLDPIWYYVTFFFVGIASGYWAVFMTIAAEQFGTNLRSTVTTSVPNLVRGSVIILTSLFSWIGSVSGPLIAAGSVGIIALSVGLISLHRLAETHGRDLAFEEM